MVIRHTGFRLSIWSFFLLVPMLSAQAQAPLFLVDEDTQVRKIAFQFDSTRTFEESQLKEQIATAEPGFFDKIKRILPFMDPAPYPFSPLALQRDVARLRRYYQQNGFIHTRVGYEPSRLDTAKNQISIVFSIYEGPPVTVRSIRYFMPDSSVFPEEGSRTWEGFDNAVNLKEGNRYSEFERQRANDEATVWIKDRGYAFAVIRDTVVIDSTANVADMRFVVDPGPLAYFDKVQVEGNQSVDNSVIERELPFEPGDRFSAGKITQGQREVFALNLFRTALADIPNQPVDSTVSVRVRVQEARPQLLTYQAGFDRESGVSLEGEWRHRNFLGAARTLTATLALNTGYGAVPTNGLAPERLVRLGVGLRQPYLLTTKLSATLSPFIQYERRQDILTSDKPFGVNLRELGVNTTFLYEVLPFRTASLQHTFSRAVVFAPPSDNAGLGDRFNRSIFTLSGAFGRNDNYINPYRGLMVRPSVEFADEAFGSAITYLKSSAEVTGFLTFTKKISVAGRLFGGRLWPTGDSRNQADPIVENRFDPIRFYAGGGNDLRGWGERMAGPKITRADISLEDGVPVDTTFYYESVGGLSKLSSNLELRLPFPGLGSNFGTAVFTGTGGVCQENFGSCEFRTSVGAGLRYLTPVGYVRLDLAYKVNPDDEDLRSPEDIWRYNNQGAPYPEAKWFRRFMLHLSIGQAF